MSTASRESTDPAALPLFAAAPTRPGRVRGGFSMRTHDVEVASAAAIPMPPRRGRIYNGDLDWSLIAGFRKQASDQLSAALGQDRGRLSVQDQQERGRAIIIELLSSEAAERVADGRDSWTVQEQADMATAIFDALFGLGRLQPLVDDDTVENIIITGYDRVMLELVDGRLVPGPPVADSDEELIEFLVFLASRSEVNARSFSEAQPRLHLRLDGGARLAAAAWVTPRPSVVIRRHRLRQVTLADMVNLGALSPVAASFLDAAVKAGKSIVVAGSQGAGKTTMVRALCASIPKWEAIGTFETEYELHLNELTGDRFPADAGILASLAEANLANGKELQAVEIFRRALKQSPGSVEIRAALKRAELIVELDPAQRGLSLRERGRRWNKLLTLVLQAAAACGDSEGTPQARRLERNRSNRLDMVDEKMAAILTLWNNTDNSCKQDPALSHILSRVK